MEGNALMKNPQTTTEDSPYSQGAVHQAATRKFPRVSRPGRVSFHLTQDQYDKLVSRHGDSHLHQMLGALVHCYDDVSAREIIVQTLFIMSKANEHYFKIATDALSCTTKPQFILEASHKNHDPQ